jgi:hypothetical protein
VLSLSSLIEFLLDMLRDEQTQADFARDPNATLAARGLSDVTAQDVRDVQPMLDDLGGVHRLAHDAGEHAGGHAQHGGVEHGGSGRLPVHESPHDVVREIHHVTHEYAVARPVTHVTQEYKSYNSFTEFRTTDNSVHASDGSTVVQNSFNQDNDGVDNKGGVIQDGSTVAGDDMGQSGNDTATTTIDDSGNDSHAVTETGSENTTVDQDWHDVGNDEHADTHEADTGDDDGTHQSIAYGEPYGDDSGGDTGGDSYGGDPNDSYSSHAPVADLPTDAPEPVGAEHA